MHSLSNLAAPAKGTDRNSSQDNGDGCAHAVAALHQLSKRPDRKRLLDRLLQRRGRRSGAVVLNDEESSGAGVIRGFSDDELASSGARSSDSDSEFGYGRRWRCPVDIRTAPYVGYQVHAPPSPQLCFKTRSCKSSSSTGPARCSQLKLPPLLELEVHHRWTFAGLPEELWIFIISKIAAVPAIPTLARVGKTFCKALRSDKVWQDQEIQIGPKALEEFAPRLGSWLPAWRSASVLVLPKSQQLLAEVARLAPHLRVELAWRFHTQLRGAGVEVRDSGIVAQRICDTELVVLGDTHIRSVVGGKGPFFEVCLDERGEDIGDGVNDFGLGVTACDPDEIDADEMGAVAVEIPSSWVVDFMQTGVVLSVNDRGAATGDGITSSELKEGDRVGLRFIPSGPVEVFLNGLLREKLVPPPEARVPAGVGLYPVVDLCGRSGQISRTRNAQPVR